jgi:hypothetical protein
LAKLLPLQVHSDTTSNAIINELRVISVPAGHYMTPEALAAMQIKHTPAAEGMTFPASMDSGRRSVARSVAWTIRS